VPDLARLERLGLKSAQNIKNSSDASKKVPFERVVFALGIRFVGETVAKKLAFAFKDINALESASYDELVAVDEIGDRIAQSVLKFFADERNISVVSRLKSSGLQMSLSEEKLQSAGDALKGQTVVISGTFTHHSRDEYKAMIEKNGGKNTGSVSAKTSFILAGDNMGPEKLKKAENLGVKLVTEDEFLELLGDKNENKSSGFTGTLF